jgi:hypothetical protein
MSLAHPAPILALTFLLAACSTAERGWSSATGTLDGANARATSTLWGPRPAPPPESLTVQRVRGQRPEVETLQPEEGAIQPLEEAPRATLANPEEALRGIPENPFRPAQTPPVTRRGSSSPPPAPFERELPAAQPLFTPPPPVAGSGRSDGQVIPTPSGPVTTTGGVGNTRSTISPQGSGLAIQDGPTTTIIGPGGRVQVVPTPR